MLGLIFFKKYDGEEWDTSIGEEWDTLVVDVPLFPSLFALQEIVNIIP